MFAAAHVQTALQLVQSYKGDMPFVHYSKTYFSAHKKHGSRDRKQILQLCYCWFRMGHTLQQWPPEQRMLTGLFLCSDTPNPLLGALKPDWNEKAILPLAEKCLLAGCGEHELAIFPWTDALSAGIDAGSFSLSHLHQPDLFIRIRPGHKNAVINVLESKWIEYKLVGENSIRLPNGFKVEEHFVLNKQVVIQDLSSQKVGELFELLSPALVKKDPFRIWDACAASGGKSIMAIDKFPSASLTVTDKRTSILHNLTERFRYAGIKNYHRFAVDLSEQEASIPQQDFIIADVPCSGSGTWSRTPEQLTCFDPASISTFSALQRKIAGNALKKLLPGGYFLYITCSVFREENEGNIAFLLQDNSLQLIRQHIIDGVEDHADTMFVALLHKP
ncbi:RsmB/NOP family class I SAM-dependent RNA methyltransferase [Flavihumibacter profundi]|uniref:Fmu (Sun) domain-containing protein n=1 Tax=Flavihumibacter profundi TaxID=2716883 RepID=UPI001CC5EEDD|nr:Fmu (Sun) domain-containing protein [Flavihumibacter profundi]MBZ5859185.1 Fmu (Sun) domain-containing protein [Flavihumibacter profundi]